MAHGGRREGAGRKKGSQNKLTAQGKDMILQALDGAGGVDYLVTQAERNPNAFLGLIGKVLPLQVQGDPDEPITHKVAIEFVCTNTDS